MSRARLRLFSAIASAFVATSAILPAVANENVPINFDQLSNTATVPLVSTAPAKADAAPKTASAPRPLADAAPSGIRARAAHHAAQHNLPPKLADAIIKVESRYNPRAVNAGNYGLMQIRLQTARGVGYSGGAAGLLDADTNLRYGMVYLAQAYRAAGGDICGTVMRYQSGLGARRMSGANRAYCAKIRQHLAQG